MRCWPRLMKALSSREGEAQIAGEAPATCGCAEVRSRFLKKNVVNKLISHDERRVKARLFTPACGTNNLGSSGGTANDGAFQPRGRGARQTRRQPYAGTQRVRPLRCGSGAREISSSTKGSITGFLQIIYSSSIHLREPGITGPRQLPEDPK